MISIQELIGEKIYRVGRAAAMCWLHFGCPVEIAIQGKRRIVGEFALDLDCPFRIRNGSGQIELGSADMFDPASGHDLDAEFNWDIQGNTLFDEKVRRLFPENAQITVTSAALSESNDLTITFSNGFVLECFVNVSSQEECWRLFRPGTRSGDLIARGTGIETL